MKKSLFIGQKVKDEGSKVLFVGVFMFVGNGFSNEKPQISTGRFCSLRCALYSVICSLLSVLCTLILPLVLLAIVAGSLFYPFFCRSKEPKPRHTSGIVALACVQELPRWGATSFSRQWLAARLLTLLIWGRRNSPAAQTSCALIQNVAKPRSIPYGDGLFLEMFGGWKAKQYNCPSSKRDEH